MGMGFKLAASALLASTATAASALPPGFEAKADALVTKAWPADGPGAAIIITDDGRTVYSRGIGLANVEARTPVTPQSVFRIGSITKQFTAAVILQLVEEGRMSLDDPISKYFPDFPQPGAAATVTQLLNHTSGIFSYTSIPGFMSEANTARPYTTAEMIALFRDLPAPQPPGQAFTYNNSGYVMLGAIIEKVTGKPWHEVVDERLVRPLGLKTIRYGTVEGEMPNMAAGYTMKDGKVAPSMRIHMSVPHAAGALIGSVEDLAKWAQALHHGRVVKSPLYARMIAPTPLPNGETSSYGFGLAPGEVRGKRVVGHGGGIFGFSTESVYIPEEDIFIAVFTNSDEPATSPGLAAQKLAALALGNPFPEFQRTEADPASLAPMLGVYTLPDAKGERRFFARDGKLFTLRSGGSEREVFHAGNGRFFYGADDLTWFEMRRDASGKPVMAMHQSGAELAELSVLSGPIPAEAPVAAIPRATLERYVGRYSAGPGTVTIAFDEADKLTLQLGAQRRAELRPASATEFRIQGVDARVVFHEEAGAVKRLVLHQGGRELPAERIASAAD